MHSKVKVAEQPVTTPSTSKAIQQAPTAPTVQSSVALATSKKAAVQSLIEATCTQQMTPVHDIQPLTGRIDVTPHQPGHVSEAPQCFIK